MSKIVVYHGHYGCETGCCGHVVEVDDQWQRAGFTFDHPRLMPGWTPERRAAEIREFVEQVLKEEYPEGHLDDIDWENCIVLDD